MRWAPGNCWFLGWGALETLGQTESARQPPAWLSPPRAAPTTTRTRAPGRAPSPLAACAPSCPPLEVGSVSGGAVQPCARDRHRCCAWFSQARTCRHPQTSIQLNSRAPQMAASKFARSCQRATFCGRQFGELPRSARGHSRQGCAARWFTSSEAARLVCLRCFASGTLTNLASHAAKLHRMLPTDKCAVMPGGRMPAMRVETACRQARPRPWSAAAWHSCLPCLVSPTPPTPPPGA